MAYKKKPYYLTESQRRRYDKLLENRRNIIKLLKQGKQIGLEYNKTLNLADKNDIPDLVLPKRVRNQPYFKSKFDFKTKYAQMRDFRSTEFYFKKHYKDEVLKLWRDQISEVNININNKPVTPETQSGYYSAEQIASNSDMREYMRMYNKMKSLSTTLFMEAYNKGAIQAFRYIYVESVQFGNRGGTGKSYNTYLANAYDKLETFLEAKYPDKFSEDTRYRRTLTKHGELYDYDYEYED